MAHLREKKRDFEMLEHIRRAGAASRSSIAPVPIADQCVLLGARPPRCERRRIEPECSQHGEIGLARSDHRGDTKF